MRQMRNAGLALLVLAVSAGAQGKGQWELGGTVAGFSVQSMDVAGTSVSTTNIGLNGGTTIRAGKMVTDKVQIEPNVSFASSSSDNFSSTATDLGVAALFIFKAMEEGKPGFYAQGNAGMTMTKVESGGSTITDETRTHFGAGVGMKRMAMGVLWRVEGFLDMMPEKDTSPAVTEFGLKVGGGFVVGKKAP